MHRSISQPLMIKIRISTCHHILYFIWSILGKCVLGIKFMFVLIRFEFRSSIRSVARMDSRITYIHTHRDLSILNRLPLLNYECNLTEKTFEGKWVCVSSYYMIVYFSTIFCKISSYIKSMVEIFQNFVTFSEWIPKIMKNNRCFFHFSGLLCFSQWHWLIWFYPLMWPMSHSFCSWHFLCSYNH